MATYSGIERKTQARCFAHLAPNFRWAHLGSPPCRSVPVRRARPDLLQGEPLRLERGLGGEGCVVKSFGRKSWLLPTTVGWRPSLRTERSDATRVEAIASRLDRATLWAYRQIGMPLQRASNTSPGASALVSALGQRTVGLLGHKKSGSHWITTKEFRGVSCFPRTCFNG